MWVIAIRGTNIKAVMRTALGVAEILSSPQYKHCFGYSIYIIVRDKPSKCYESDRMIKYIEEKPAIVLLSPNQFLKEIEKLKHNG